MGKAKETTVKVWTLGKGVALNIVDASKARIDAMVASFAKVADLAEQSLDAFTAFMTAGLQSYAEIRATGGTHETAIAQYDKEVSTARDRILANLSAEDRKLYDTAGGTVTLSATKLQASRSERQKASKEGKLTGNARKAHQRMESSYALVSNVKTTLRQLNSYPELMAGPVEKYFAEATVEVEGKVVANPDKITAKQLHAAASTAQFTQGKSTTERPTAATTTAEVVKRSKVDILAATVAELFDIGEVALSRAILNLAKRSGVVVADDLAAKVGIASDAATDGTAETVTVPAPRRKGRRTGK